MTSKHFFFSDLKQFLRRVRQSKLFYNSQKIVENSNSFEPFWAPSKTFLWTLLGVSVDVIKQQAQKQLREERVYAAYAF